MRRRRNMCRSPDIYTKFWVRNGNERPRVDKILTSSGYLKPGLVFTILHFRFGLRLKCVLPAQFYFCYLLLWSFFFFFYKLAIEITHIITLNSLNLMCLLDLFTFNRKKCGKITFFFLAESFKLLSQLFV